jgi:cation transport ATPase
LSTITGESLPAEKLPGSAVYAGTINQSGVIEVRTEGIGRDTAFGKIVEAVERAEQSRAPIQKTVERLAGFLVYFTLGCAVLTFLAAQIEDALRPEAVQAVAALRKMGLRTVLLTGDVAAIARAVGKQLGLDEVHAKLLPEEKVAKIKSLRAAGKRVAMVGDGINDAPALTEANVGVAMGLGVANGPARRPTRASPQASDHRA